MKKVIVMVIAGSLLCLSGCSSGGSAMGTGEKKSVSLFNGTDLTGWKQLSGAATYKVVDGMIEGTTAGKEDDENAFLATEKNYGDFILEVDFKVAGMNSGIQIRSESMPEYKNGRVHGYQVEIDESARAWSGGIYDEARRRWINNLLNNEAARKAFKKDDWNHYRIEAIGDSIKTWVNGVPATDLVDSMTLKGFIALQVHSSKNAGRKVWWKNIRIQDLSQHVWKPIFDGKSLDGWKTADKGQWQVADGAIQGTCRADSPNGTVLAYGTPMSDYTLRLKYKAVKGQGSLYMLTPKADSPTTLTGLNAAIDTAANGMTGALCDNVKVLQKPYKGEKTDWDWLEWQQIKPGDWNQLTVSVHGKRVVVFVNDHKTAELKDYAGPALGQTALMVKGGMDGEIWFKDIEILTPEKK